MKNITFKKGLHALFSCACSDISSNTIIASTNKRVKQKTPNSSINCTL